MVGTRGVPAAYGGFETAVEEVGQRLAQRGHDVLVYSRGGAERVREHLGMRVLHLPALPVKQAETLSHTALSVARACTVDHPDVAFVFNAANAPLLGALRLRGIPFALHMDGLEWRRSKWGPRGRAYYRWAEQRGVRVADALIADAPGIADYYDEEFGVATELLRYGAPVLHTTPAHEAALAQLGLRADGYHLVVARFEQENHVLEIVQGYRNSAARLPLVVVGSAPYAAEYTLRIRGAAAGDERIKLLGAVYDQNALDALYAHASTYLHGHSVGGTNPSLLRAMGAGTAVIAKDVVFNRETLGETGWFFTTTEQIASALNAAEASPEVTSTYAKANRERAADAFRWSDVADGYEQLARRLVAGVSVHREARRARRSARQQGYHRD